MDSLFLLQFACFIFMLINAFIVAVSHLHVRWENKRYERSRLLIVVAMIGLAIQYVIQMAFGFRAADDILGAVINILIYTPCFSLIAIAIYNIETTRANRRKMNLVCGGIYAAILVVFWVGISLHHSLYIKEGLYMMLALFCMSVAYSISMIVREMIRRKKMLETMAATDMLPYVRYSRASIFILCLSLLIMPAAIFSTTLLFIIGPLVLFACCSSILRLSLSAAAISLPKNSWIKKRKTKTWLGLDIAMGKHILTELRVLLITAQSLYSRYPMSTEISSRRVLMHGAPIQAIRTVP